MQQQKKPFSLMVFIKPHRAGFITSVILAVLSVASGMVPYFAVARMVNLLISGEKNFFDLSGLGRGSHWSPICSSPSSTAFLLVLSRGPFHVYIGCGGLWRIS